MSAAFNTRAVRAIVRKDLKVVMQSKAVLMPLIIVPIIMLIVMPVIVTLIATLAPVEALSDLTVLLERMPQSLQETLAPYDARGAMVVLVLTYLFAPLYLIVPMMFASVIAADSFAGEKERKTLEALIYTPTSDLELILAKMLGAWLPAVGTAWLGFIVYTVVANIAAFATLGHIILPNALWLSLALWVAPAVAGLGLGATVLVSARVNSFQEAYQLGGVVVLPLVALIISQATGVIYLSVTFTLLLGLVVWLIDALLLFYSVKGFRRGEMMARL